jgi:hypothetical protein
MGDPCAAGLEIVSKREIFCYYHFSLPDEGEGLGDGGIYGLEGAWSSGFGIAPDDCSV